MCDSVCEKGLDCDHSDALMCDFTDKQIMILDTYRAFLVGREEEISVPLKLNLISPKLLFYTRNTCYQAMETNILL